jgi:hypothetical protein
MRGWYRVPAMFHKLPGGRHPDWALAIAGLVGEENPNDRATFAPALSGRRWRVGRGSSIVPGGQCAVCGLGPRANDHARRTAYDLNGESAALPCFCLMGRDDALNPTARTLKLVNVTPICGLSSYATRPDNETYQSLPRAVEPSVSPDPA